MKSLRIYRKSRYYKIIPINGNVYATKVPDAVGTLISQNTDYSSIIPFLLAFFSVKTPS